jgi:hypothetical protein
MAKKKEPEIMICIRHDHVMELCDDALKVLKGNAKLTLEDKKILRDQIREIKLHIRSAKISGQSMEDRLREYRYAIEELGFERVY